MIVFIINLNFLVEKYQKENSTKSIRYFLFTTKMDLRIATKIILNQKNWIS